MADAVIEVLADHGIPADSEPRGADRDVMVPVRRREDAWEVLSKEMEQVQQRTEGGSSSHHTGFDGGGYDPSASDYGEFGGNSEPRPLVTERFRNMAFVVAIILLPMLILTLSRVRIPMSMVLVIMAGAATVLLLLRNARKD